MKKKKINYPLLFIIFASFLTGGCAILEKSERGKGACDRGQYWSRSAEGCVPAPGP